jgi:two-component system chemotaxis response regulator CheB
VQYELVAIGTSWGGLSALSRLLADLPAELDQAIVIAQHRSTESSEGGLRGLLQSYTDRVIRDAEDKDPIERRHVYLAPPDYHLLVEPGWLALSVDDVVQFARPSIDVLFESVADAYGERAIGIILTGANDDGASGLACIKQRGGVAIVQDPGTSERRHMPDAAIAAVDADAVLPIEEMSAFLYGLCCEVAARSEQTSAQAGGSAPGGRYA